MISEQGSWDQVRDHTRSPKSKVWYQIKVQVKCWVRNQVWDQFRNQVSSQVWDQIVVLVVDELECP